MSPRSRELENLVDTGVLKPASTDKAEIEALIHSGEARLKDARNESLALESRFDLAYNAAHALSLAALRRLGYRSENRQAVFQTLPHTVGMDAGVWRVLAQAHGVRHRSEYEGRSAITEKLVTDVVAAAETVLKAIRTSGKSRAEK